MLAGFCTYMHYTILISYTIAYIYNYTDVCVHIPVNVHLLFRVGTKIIPYVQWSNLSSIKEVQKIGDNCFGNNRFVEYTNSVSYVLSKSVCDKEKFTGNCICCAKEKIWQSPITSRNDTRFFIKGLNRESKVVCKLMNLI